MVIKKNMQNQNKFVGNSQSFASPPPPSATVYMLEYSSFWNHKAKSYGIKTTSYAHKTTSFAHETTSYAHKTTSYAHKTTSYAHKTTSCKFKTYKFDSWNY